MRRVVAEPVANRADFTFTDLVRGAVGPGPGYAIVDGRVVVLDSRLEPVASTTAGAGRLLAATPDLGVVVLAGDTEVVVQRGTTIVRAAIAQADSAVVLADGTVLVTAPRLELLGSDGDEYLAKGAHRVLLVAVDGGIADEVELDVYDADVSAIAHPHDGSVVLDAGEGQDGSHVFRVRVVGGQLAVEHLLTDEIVVDFRPSGDRVLVMPHPTSGGPVRVYTWPDLRPVAEYDPHDRVDLHGCFLTDDRVLLGGLDDGELRRFMICTASLVPVTLVEVPDSHAAEFEQLHGMAADAFGVDVWRDGHRAATVWRIPDLD